MLQNATPRKNILYDSAILSRRQVYLVLAKQRPLIDNMIETGCINFLRVAKFVQLALRDKVKRLRIYWSSIRRTYAESVNFGI